MPDALWIQAPGVDYSAAEDRHALSAMYNPGIIDGLIISAGTGLQAQVSAGRAAIDDGVGGCYIVYFQTSSTVGSLTPSATNNIYIVVDPTGATPPSIVKSGATPTNPYLQLGSSVTSTSAVTSSNNTAPRAEFPTVAGRYLLLSGGTVAGKVTFSQVDIGPGGMVSSGAFAPQFPLGVRLGGAGGATMRAYLRAVLSARQSIPPSTWTKIAFNSRPRAIDDYGTNDDLMDTSTTTGKGRFLIPVKGDYHFSGTAHFINQVGTTNTRRLSRLVVFNADGSTRWIRNCTQRAAGGNEDAVAFDAMLDCDAGQWVEFQVYHDESHSVYLSDNGTGSGSLADGLQAVGAMRLLMAD